MKNLIIVESPTKAKTISHFLGKNFEVIASYGHVRDLPKSKLGIDVENNFTPHYIIPVKIRKKVNELKKIAKEAKEIILATDEDREGEAIAWHLTQILNLANEPKRIAFHEITKPAIEEALKNPREINMDLVNAQQGRRILDRLVGYELSPFLWKKVFRGLSAGRVQSPALRLIIEREKEREAFKQEEYFTISALMQKIKSTNQQTEIKFETELWKINNKSLPSPGIKNKDEAENIKTELENKTGLITDIKTSQNKKYPLSPFTTSTLQQASWQAFRFPAKKTMFLAQSLYEGKDLGNGSQGLITYMRTDSLNLSPLALQNAKEFLEKSYGAKYALKEPRVFKSKSKLVQEAHEAIRPTDSHLEPDKIQKYLSRDEFKLYHLIWSRFLASQMPEALLEKNSLSIEVQSEKNQYLFQTHFYHLVFDGFLKIYQYQKLPELMEVLPSFVLKDKIQINELLLKQHSTQPPPRYNDATLIKTLEAFGIGRPSTYAPIISVLQGRGYILRDENKALAPTEIGFLVNNVLVKHFETIVDYQFTSQIEEKLDEIAQGKLIWQKAIKDFYLPFKKNLMNKYDEVSKEEVSPITQLDEKCPLCGNPLITRLGKYGKFISCSDWPKCKYTRSLNNNKKLNIKCPKCHEGEVILKRNKRGKMFYACSRWPDCDFASSLKPTGENCPKCSSFLVETKIKTKCSDKKCDYEILKNSDN
ncbi:MAG: type I DNA topoisomerase [Candidatus Paceibacterota bacterium]|jgi:DNA topoisomerase-1